MKQVYLAEDTRLANRPCALAEMIDIFTDPLEQQAAVQSFTREADLLAQLKHEHIVQILDRFNQGNRHFLVMEYIEGETLEEKLRRTGGKLELGVVIAAALQILDALEYLHSHTPPIIYRDLKPSNVMMTLDGQAKLIDFGIARLFQPQSTATMVGTQGYAPPEQYSGKAEPRSDLYALGATMHQLLSGRDPSTAPPFSYPPIQAIQPDLDPALCTLVNEALSYKIDQRVANAAEFRRRLALLAGEAADEPYTQPLAAPITPATMACRRCARDIPTDASLCPYCGAGLGLLGMPAASPNEPTLRLVDAASMSNDPTVAPPSARQSMEPDSNRASVRAPVKMASRLANKAQLLLDQGKKAEAIEVYTEALSYDSFCREAWEGRGRLHFNLENYQKAIDDLTEAETRDSKRKGDAWYHRCVGYHRMRAFANLCLKQYQEALTEYRLLENEPFWQKGCLLLSHMNAERLLQLVEAHAPSRIPHRFQVGMDETGTHFVLIFPWNPDLVAAIKYMIPPGVKKWNPESKRWLINGSTEGLQFILPIVQQYKFVFKPSAYEYARQLLALGALEAKLEIPFYKEYYNRGLAKFGLKSYHAAIDDFTRALTALAHVKTDPASAMRIRYMRALAHKQLGSTFGAEYRADYRSLSNKAQVALNRDKEPGPWWDG